MSNAVPPVAIHTYFKNMVKPKKEEGFTHPIIEIPYVQNDQNSRIADKELPKILK